MVLGESRCREVAQSVLETSRADQTEAVLIGTRSALTRFAGSGVHQNVHEVNAELRVRTVLGQRIGVAATNDLSPDSIRRVVDLSLAIAERQREDPDFPGLPRPAELRGVDAYDPPTAEYGPLDRARGVKMICDLAEANRLVASGAFSTSIDELAITNSRGVWAWQRSTRSSLKTVIMGDDEAAGYAEWTGRCAGALDPEAIGREAVDKARRSSAARALPAGRYDVVLEEYAVAEALDYLAWAGFGGLALQQGQSFLSERLGQRIMSEQITICDDGTDPRGLPAAFDFEGVPKQRVALIESGVARGVVYDSRTAAQAGRRSTGHALPAPNTYGPFPWNLVMAPGTVDRAGLAAGIRRGLWVTRFHYVNVLQPRQAVLTGMTRDGTFLIEDGEVGEPVKNLRFTQNMLEALSAVRAVGSQVKAVEGYFGAALAPALAIEGFNFTGEGATAA